MSSQSEVDRLRKEVQGLQQKIAGESSKVATARAKEASNRERASKASTASSASSRSTEANRQAKAAVAAEKRRAELEKKLATKQKSLHTAEARLGKKQEEEQKRVIRNLQTSASTAERQFRPSRAELFSARLPDTASAHDVFISHASEDKQAVARPLADLLIDRGIEVWYDDFTLTVGDSLRRSIDRGLAGSRFGVIILSTHFFRKEWPQAELDGLVAKQRASGSKVILPIWHRVTKDDVLAASPTLADLKALNTGVMTLAEIADEIAAVAKAA